VIEEDKEWYEWMEPMYHMYRNGIRDRTEYKTISNKELSDGQLEVGSGLSSHQTITSYMSIQDV